MSVSTEISRVSYFNDGTAVVDYENGVQTFSMTVPESHAPIVAELLPMCAYGPNYRRGAADALSSYYRLVRRNGAGDAESAEYWLEQANGAR